MSITSLNGPPVPGFASQLYLLHIPYACYFCVDRSILPVYTVAARAVLLCCVSHTYEKLMPPPPALLVGG